ncbi:hypothetical protein O9992_04260 [Vibrio lentus]|nr:hypothetical protein [Vibrio lentus]
MKLFERPVVIANNKQQKLVRASNRDPVANMSINIICSLHSRHGNTQALARQIQELLNLTELRSHAENSERRCTR